MSVDYIVASLPTLAFGVPAPISWEKFVAQAQLALPHAVSLSTPAVPTPSTGSTPRPPIQLEFQALAVWKDLETQLRNAMAEARGGESRKRPADGCSLYWKNRVLACFQEKDVLKRDELLDRVWWDAAGELTPPASPLGEGALATYAIRLKIALKRAKISQDDGNAAFDRLTAETRVS